MTGNVVAVIAVVVGIVWLGVLFVSAIRNRGSEEVPHNLRPGTTDQEMETRRLETGQKAAIAFSAFLALSLPIYFLTEPARQEGFVEQFDEESVERGAHLVEEFACFSCHGPEGVGGTASYIEKRSGVNVAWSAPSLNDVGYRYDDDELNFWVTFGRGNTPMPAWGLAGGGPLNEAQVVDVVNYLGTIQIPQVEAVNEVPSPVTVELTKLENADAIVAAAILAQAQVVAEVKQAPKDSEFLEPLAEQADEVLDGAEEGIDTDDDGLSDSAEAELSAISREAVEGFTVVDPIVMDPQVADAEKADEAVATLEAALDTDPIVVTNLVAVNEAIDTGSVEPGGLDSTAASGLVTIADQAAEAGISVPSGPYDTVEAGESLVAALEEAAAAEDAPTDAGTMATDAAVIVDAGSDPDGDGFSTAAENDITNQVADAGAKTIPPQIIEIDLDPLNPESVGGQPDQRTASTFVGNLQSLATSLSVSAENIDQLLEAEESGLEFLEAAAESKSYEIDIAGVTASMGVDEADAARAVGLFNANCARCHTAGWSAGLPYTQEAGSGGFGPALWDGRPMVQFGEAVTPDTDDLLIQFLVLGSRSETPYGLNGFGSGRMPAFGAILPADDIRLLATYVRAGNMDGKG